MKNCTSLEMSSQEEASHVVFEGTVGPTNSQAAKGRIRATRRPKAPTLPKPPKLSRFLLCPNPVRKPYHASMHEPPDGIPFGLELRMDNR